MRCGSVTGVRVWMRMTSTCGMARSAAGTFRTVFKMFKGLWIVRRVAHA